MRNINLILQSIKDYKGIRTNTALAEFLGVSRSAISNWISRGTLDEKLICKKIPEIRLEFLRTGEFPMTEQSEIVNTLLRRIEILEQMVAKLEEYGKN
jgi:hypothetical protein